jgi:hypothetical protein
MACVCAVAQITASGKFDPMAPTKADGALRNLFVDTYDIEATQKAPRRSFERVAGANHDLHPCDDADRLRRIALKLGAGFGDGVEVIDQNVGVEQRLHHSLRTFS